MIAEIWSIMLLSAGISVWYNREMQKLAYDDRLHVVLMRKFPTIGKVFTIMNKPFIRWQGKKMYGLKE